MDDLKTKVAKILLGTKAVKLNVENPFIWSSGWKSPIYCDNRTVLSFPEERLHIKKWLSAKVKEEFPEATAIVGVATAGIAMGVLVAEELGLSYAYCRPKPKEHGLKKQLEGRLEPNAQVVVLEDLISTGGSSLKVVEYLRTEGFHVLGMAAIFTYGFKQASQNFLENSCKCITLGDYESLIEVAIATGYVQEQQLESLKAWRQRPESWRQLR